MAFGPFQKKTDLFEDLPSIWGLNDNWSSGHRLEKYGPNISQNEMAPLWQNIKKSDPFSCCVGNFSQIKLLDFEESVADSKLELGG